MGNKEVSSVLITGANAGIGRELARQLGAREDISRVYLGCRDRSRGRAALDGLAAEAGRDVFELLIIDVADVHSVRSAVAALVDQNPTRTHLIRVPEHKPRCSGAAAGAQDGRLRDQRARVGW